MSKKVNPLLAGINNIPGETFRLPSGGLFYTNGEFDESVKDGEVHVYPMKTVDELIMKSPDKILTGKAIEEVFSRCIPDIKKPDELLAADVDYLLAAIRVVSYGDDAEITTTHTCDDAKEHTYVVNIRDIIREGRELDPTSLDTNYKMKLEEYTISIRPPKFRSVINLYQTISEEFLKNADEEEVAIKMIQNLSDMIAEVNGTNDPEFILEWLTNIKAGWVNKISDFTRKTSNWGIEYTRDVKCKDCNEKFEISIPTNPITFFM